MATESHIDQTDGPRTGAPRAVFVIGTPRSGTTVLGNWIGSSPAVLNLAEYGGFFVALQMAPRVVGRWPGYFHAEYLAELRLHARGFAEHHAATAGCSWYCDSSPWNLEVAGALAETVPDALYVLTLRHYAGTILSLRQMQWSGETWEDAAHIWAQLNAQVSALPADRVIPVSYEALAAAPEATLRDLRRRLADHGFPVDGIDDRVLATSHAAVIGHPRPTVAVMDGGDLRFQAIRSFDAERWCGDMQKRVWPIVKDTHEDLLLRYPGVYQSPAPPTALTSLDPRLGAVPYTLEGW